MTVKNIPVQDIPESGDVLTFFRLHERFIFYMMSLFGALLGLFSILAYFASQLHFAVMFCLAAVSILVGLSLQAVLGLPFWLRLYYCLCGACVFLYMIYAGNGDGGRLIGPLSLVPGFVALLGHRQGIWYLLLLMTLACGLFFFDLRITASATFPFLTEVRFLVCYVGLSIFSLAWEYTWQKYRLQIVEDNEKTRELAFRDHMTGLANRRAMEELLHQRWDEYQRTGQVYSFLLCDVDNLKTLNDLFGHEFGDIVLSRVANVLGHGLRAQDVLARWGGDEFLILLPGQTQNTALKAAERLRKRIQDIELTMKKEKVPVSLSIGLVSANQVLDPEDLFAIADGALYQAKHMGRNQVVAG